MVGKRFLPNAAARARRTPRSTRQQAAGPVRTSLVIEPTHALVAQLDRASDFESEGREFESLRARHIHKGPFRTRGNTFGPWIGGPSLQVSSPKYPRSAYYRRNGPLRRTATATPQLQGCLRWSWPR